MNHDKQTEALKLALEALEKCDSALAEELAAWDIDPPLHHVLEASNACGPAITAIREALAEQPAPGSHLTDEQKAANGIAWLARLEAMREEFAGLAEQPAQQQEPVTWRGHVEQRLLTWRQSFMNKSGDQLELDDFMDKRSLDDLIDFVCSEYTSPPASKPLPPVDGDLLPPVGSQVLIHLASQDQWVAHTVVGYYVWGAFDSDGLHRVFVRVQDSDGILNARSLCDVRAIETAHGIKGDA